MRILIDNGSYLMVNQGDIAMLQVAVARLRTLWPEAALTVVTHEPEALAKYCPDVEPLTLRQRYDWYRLWRLSGRFYHKRPARVSHRWLRMDRYIWRGLPVLGQAWSRLRRRQSPSRADIAEINAFLSALFAADLVVASGGGYIMDGFRHHAGAVLDTLETAQQLGKPTAMFSQGLGPVQYPSLRAKAKAVFPKVDLIALRERPAGLPFLVSLGVSPDRIVITGDDSIELAYRERAARPGAGIGISLRTSWYSEVDSRLIEMVRLVVHSAARRYGAPLIPVPISFHQDESDVDTICRLISGFNHTSDEVRHLNTPAKVIEQAGQCRMVVTGCYHAAVFALAQGIPAVGLARSAYYRNKFMGLADQFGPGCQVLTLDDDHFQENLEAAIDRAWQSADQIRPVLLGAAAYQIEAGRAAYQHLGELVEARQLKLPEQAAKKGTRWRTKHIFG